MTLKKLLKVRNLTIFVVLANLLDVGYICSGNLLLSPVLEIFYWKWKSGISYFPQFWLHFYWKWKNNTNLWWKLPHLFCYYKSHPLISVSHHQLLQVNTNYGQVLEYVGDSSTTTTTPTRFWCGKSSLHKLKNFNMRFLWHTANNLS